MKKQWFENQILWIILGIVYLLGLLLAMGKWHIDFLQLKNTILLLPLYGFSIVISQLQHKKDTDDSRNRFTILILFSLVTGVVALFQCVFHGVS